MFWKRVLLLMLGLLAPLLVLELAYRINLYWKWRWAPLDPWLYSFFALSKPSDQYSEPFGFEYPPGIEVFSVYLKQGYPYYGWPVRANRMGNIGRENELEKTEDLRVLIFGDSFTSMYLDGLTWPDIFQDELSQAAGLKVQVFNFGRGGYGVLQMVDLAAARVSELSPDLVIFAFIADDLARARYWRTVNTLHGMVRVLTTTQPTPLADLAASVDSYVVNTNVSPAWYEHMISSRHPEDPLLQELNNQCRLIKKQNARYIPFASCRRSFLYNRLVHRNPMYGLPKPSELPRTALTSYRDDARFEDDIRRIKEQGAPRLLVLLPDKQDILSGHYLLTDDQRALLASLADLMQTNILSLLDYLPPPPPDVKTKWFWPVDNHPSAIGLRNFAEALTRALGERKFDGLRRPDPAEVTP